MSPATQLTAEGFGFVSEAVWAVETVAAATQLGVLGQLDSGWVTASDLAATHGMSHHQGRLLLKSLAGLGLAKTEEGTRFTAAVPGLSTLTRHLLPDGGLLDVLRGIPPRTVADTAAGSASLYPEMVRFLASGFREAASVAADLLVRPGLRVLDLGAGAAPWSVAIVQRDETIPVVAVDLPEVIPVTRAVVEEAGLGHRFQYQAGDFFEIDLGEERYDLVIAGGICHLFGEDTNRRLLGKVSRALAPGGILAIIEPLPNDRFDGPRSVLLYALNLTTRTATGSVYPFSTYVTWLQASGLQGVSRADLSVSPHVTLITAHKPQARGTT
jgi:ubiquinone/menaquinone biosynthesis C-methylase UbiE